MVERVGISASLQEHRLHRGQVVLETVINAGEKSRAQGDFQHPAQEFHLVSVLQSAGAFEHLDRSFVSVHLDHLCKEGSPVKGDVAEFVLRYRTVDEDRHKVGNNSGNCTFGFHIVVIVNLLERRN